MGRGSVAVRMSGSKLWGVVGVAVRMSGSKLWGVVAWRLECQALNCGAW